MKLYHDVVLDAEMSFSSDQIELFASPITGFKKSMIWLSLFLAFYVAAVLAVMMAFLFKERLVAGFSTLLIIMTPSLAIFRKYIMQGLAK